MNRGVVRAFAICVCIGGGVSTADTGAIARIGASGEFLELSHRVDGRTVVSTVPLHHEGDIRYFSAGVGLEERLAEYPPFSLKMVFTVGGKAYLSGVSVTIKPAKGGTVLTIPNDQVEGPWLFVDLPAGVYDVTATHHDSRQVRKGVKVEAEKQRVIYLSWAEDRGLVGNLPDE